MRGSFSSACSSFLLCCPSPPTAGTACQYSPLMWRKLPQNWRLRCRRFTNFKVETCWQAVCIGAPTDTGSWVFRRRLPYDLPYDQETAPPHQFSLWPFGLHFKTWVCFFWVLPYKACTKSSKDCFMSAVHFCQENVLLALFGYAARCVGFFPKWFSVSLHVDRKWTPGPWRRECLRGPEVFAASGRC